MDEVRGYLLRITALRRRPAVKLGYLVTINFRAVVMLENVAQRTWPTVDSLKSCILSVRLILGSDQMPAQQVSSNFFTTGYGS